MKSSNSRSDLLDGDAEYEEEAERHLEQLIDMPPSWVPKLRIPREVFDMRCPKGTKITAYDRCVYEIYAIFGECARWDGKVSKLTIFQDRERTKPLEVREVFARRKDRLRERRIFTNTDTTVESFNPGSAYGLKEVTTVAKKQRVAHFYESARLDGLLMRTEVFGVKMVEVFRDRDDRLVYRSATYDKVPPRPSTPPQASTGVKRVGRKKKHDDPQQPIRKMTEKYTVVTDGSVAPEECVRKRTFYCTDDQIRLDYHYGRDRITANCRIYSRDGQSQITQIDPLKAKPKDQVLLEEWQSLIVAEKECQNNVRDVEKECKAIVYLRARDEQDIKLEKPYYDIVRVKVEESDDEGA
eukprot:CAMPEP_0118939504 /NCGR_PEP_ID=MMETSP1169-20130426/29098_1 /TAXON_ID=36882 /ORGANISM="Pyramimonas obovata, Strain CCMP722" /LENGTH=353 /DNA_ID=CAMNT_0006883791 /DNA_START=30 /DNA_END=1087 /DNA_ORIENTATION=+